MCVYICVYEHARAQDTQHRVHGTHRRHTTHCTQHTPTFFPPPSCLFTAPAGAPVSNRSPAARCQYHKEPAAGREEELQEQQRQQEAGQGASPGNMMTEFAAQPLREPQVRVCMCACVYACVRACVHVCMRACVRACMHACVRACVREVYQAEIKQLLLLAFLRCRPTCH